MRSLLLTCASAAVIGLAVFALDPRDGAARRFAGMPLGAAAIGSLGVLDNPATAQQSNREGQSALNGSLYAIVAPTFSGTTSSFIRLFNGGSATATFSVSVLGSPSGNTYGTANISVPVRAAPQYSLTDIRTLANAGALTGGDTNYSLYIQSTEPTAGYQHVTFNSTNNFFENVSSCRYLLNHTIAGVVNSAVLTNVHTTRLAAFPSQVEIHNYFNASTQFRLSVISARTGDVRGQMNVTLAANESRSLSMASIESSVNWQPTAEESHANIVVTDPTGAAPTVLLGQSIVNQSLSANISMSTACAVNPPSSSGGGGGLGGGGGITY